MKSGIIVFNGILLVLIGVLFYLHFSAAPKQMAAPARTATAKTPAGSSDFKIAYFNMDSLEASFAMVKDTRAELARREDAVNSEKAKMERNYKQKLEAYQRQAQSSAMNQVQSENATKEMMQLQQQIQNRSQALEQEYQDFATRKMKEIKERIETYLKEYNTQRGYAYIFAYEPGLLFYYRDTTYDITADVVDGLNKAYKTK